MIKCPVVVACSIFAEYLFLSKMLNMLLGSVDVYLKEEDDKVFSPSGKKKKDHSDSASYNYASARKKARLERNECPENKRQLNLVMAAIQANNLPSIIIRKRHRDPQNG